MEINNPEYELKLELEAFNERVNSFLNFYAYLGTADAITLRYFNDMSHEFDAVNFVNAKTCVRTLIQRLEKEKDSIYHQNVQHFFISVIEDLKHADEICDEVLNLANKDSLDEKTRLQKQRKEINIRLTEISDEKFPYLNLSLSIMFILMSIIFVFLPNFFDNSVLMYHICGAMFLLGFVLLKQEVEFRNKKGFLSHSENATNKRSIILLIQAFVYIIPLAILSIFFFDSIFLRIALYIQILFCGALFLCGLFIMINNSIKNKKVDGKSVWSIILGIITIAAFVLQLLQIFKVL